MHGYKARLYMSNGCWTNMQILTKPHMVRIQTAIYDLHNWPTTAQQSTIYVA